MKKTENKTKTTRLINTFIQKKLNNSFLFYKYCTIFFPYIFRKTTYLVVGFIQQQREKKTNYDGSIAKYLVLEFLV